MDTIKGDAIINIDISGDFYKRIRTLFDNYSKTQSPDVFKKALDSIKNNKVSDKFTTDLETLLVLIAQIEKNGEAQDKITRIPFPKKG